MMLVVSLIAGAFAAAIGVLYLMNRDEAYRLKYLPKKEAMTATVVPTRNMLAGEILTLADVARRPIPTKFVRSDVITPALLEQFAGRRLTQPVERGKPIPLSYLQGINLQDFSDIVAVGRRAVTVKISNVNSFDGMLRPGNFIDVLVGMGADEAGVTGGVDASEEVIFPILENVEVLATVSITKPRSRNRAERGIATDAEFFHRHARCLSGTGSGTKKRRGSRSPDCSAAQSPRQGCQRLRQRAAVAVDGLDAQGTKCGIGACFDRRRG